MVVVDRVERPRAEDREPLLDHHLAAGVRVLPASSMAAS